MQDKQVIVQCPEPPDVVHVGRAAQVRYEEDGSRVQVDFPPDKGPELPIGRSARLFFRIGTEGEPQEAMAKVVAREEIVDRSRYTFLFSAHVTELLAPMIGRRKSPRVSPGAGVRIPVTIGDDGEEIAVEGSVANLSTAGIAIVVPWEGEAKLAALSEVDLEFTLPGDETGCTLSGRVRNRTLQGAAILYGIEFLAADGSAETQAVLERIQEYVDVRLEAVRAASRPMRVKRRA